jgi:hypothetical protein
MIRTAAMAGTRQPAINTLMGEFEVTVAGKLRRFDTRLSSIAAIEEACGDRPVVDVLNAIIAGRRAKDLMPLLAAALAAADPSCDAESLAAEATVGEAEAFVLAFIFALGFTVGATAQGEGRSVPLDGPHNGATGAPSRSAA